MARLKEPVQLLAIGLLNYSDDEGYFFASAQLVRAALRPFDDDSTNVRANLAELEKHGYIQLKMHDTHGEIGWVVSFLNHQRIDRPKASSIKALFDSSNVRRSIDDQSLLEGKGKEQGTGKGRVAPSAPSVESIPLALNQPQFINAWEKWKQARMDMGKKPKDWNQFFNNQLDWLIQFGPVEATKIVTISTINNWQGLREPKANGHNTTSGRPSVSDERNRWIGDATYIEQDIPI